MMKKIGFVTLGCKVNIYESNALKNELSDKGYLICEPTSDCDAYIINTCSVTNQADAKSRKMIHRLRQLNRDAILCVMGCYAQTNEEARQIEGVDILVGNGNKKEVISLLEDKFLDRSIEKKMHILDILHTREYEPLEVSTYDHARAFVKIEDGCENFCSYCIIPYARGPVRCKPQQQVLNEIRRIVDAGYQEVVLSGIHTGRYEDQGAKLSDLIERILKEVPKLKRLRLSSIEINEIDDHFLSLLKTSSVLADHLHLPLQSGSDTVLAKMGRKYDTGTFQRKIEEIRKIRPRISITTDVIVGFPYETEEEFIRSKAWIQSLFFSKLHVFPYSVRKGTKAAEMPQISNEVKKKRTKELLLLSEQLEEMYAKQFIGEETEVIFEQPFSQNQMIGHSGNYLQVVCPFDEKALKKNVRVLLRRWIKENIVEGEIIKDF